MFDKFKNLFKKENLLEDKAWFDLYGKNIKTHLEYPEGSMYDVFKLAVDKYPKYTAITYFGRKINYTKFHNKVVNCAKCLRELGLERDDVITICMPNTPDALVLFYASNMIGAINNMIHPLSSEKEIEFYLNKSHSKFMLCIDMCYPKVEKIIDNTNVEKVILAKVSSEMPLYMKLIYPFVSKKTEINYTNKVMNWNEFIKLGKKYNEDCYQKRKSDDDAVILYSGGTTGDPKGVVLTNMNFNSLATQCFNMTDPAKAGDSVLTIMPLFHGFGIGVCVHTELISGMSVTLIPQFKANEFAKLIKKNKPTFLAGVPTMYEALINSKEKSKTYLKSVTNVICGGDTLNETLKDKVNKYLKDHGSIATIRVGYGLTECTGASCLTPRYFFKEGAIGIPLPDMDYKIIKDSNSFKECKMEEVGEICISGPTVMKGYLDDKKATEDVLRTGADGKKWLFTGDAGYIDEQGIIFFVSRLKRIIISSGYNVYPQYVEKIITSHPAVLTCTVVGIPHKYKQNVPKAYIVLRDGFKNTEDLRNDIKAYCSENIAKYAIPYEYEYVKDLPKTLVGKVAFTKLGNEKNNKKKNNKK